MPLDISVIILTFNEEIHIRRCIENVKPIAKEIFVIDSFSTDKTCEIAESLGAKVYQNKWENSHAKQFNWALDNLPVTTKWILRLDADEYLTNDLAVELSKKLNFLNDNVTGIILPLKRVFMGRHIKHGVGRILLLRIFRYQHAVCEARWMDEHIKILDGETIVFENEFADDNLNNIGWWTAKHNGYSIREAIDLLDVELGLFQKEQNDEGLLSEQAKRKRGLKHSYAKKPLFIRSFAYFIYRYIFKLGFTEGKEGFLWHFLQGWWYRTLVDAKIFEIKKACGNDREKIIEYISQNYSINLKEQE